jgi:hypothetical protein
MPIDPSIALSVKPVQIESPVNALSQLLQVQGAQQQNQLGQAKLDEYQRTVGRQNMVYQTMKQLGADASDDQRVNALKSLGEFDQADKVQAGQLARTKTNADAQKATADALKSNADVLNMKLQHHRDQLGPVNSPDAAASWVAAMYNDPDMAPIVQASGRTLEQQVAAIPKDPKQFAQWKMQSSLGADKLVQFTTPDANTVANNATSAANNAATNATSRANNAATVAATVRGQDLTNARTREQVAAGKVPSGYRAGPDGTLVAIPGGPADQSNKPPTEFQGKSAAFGARAEQADKILGSLEGKYSPAAINSKNSVENTWLVGGALGAATNKFALNESDQQAEQAQRDFVNAVLRQESGAAIGPSEFDNARKQYFPQPGDSTAVIQQKAANRKLAIQGLQNNAGRAAFSAPSQASGAAVPAMNAKGWTLHVDAAGNKAYVAPNGKDYEEVH